MPWSRLGTLLLVGAPVALHLLPAADSDVSAAGCWRRRAPPRATHGRGTSRRRAPCSCPDADRFSDVGALFGERTRMRAWWQDDRPLAGRPAAAHRRDRPGARRATTTLRWDYEHLEATLSQDPEIRLPRTADLVPPVLAERLLRGVTPTTYDGSPPGGWPA